MQLLRYESITHYELSLGKEETKNDQIICIESLKLSLLAKSCLCPGLVVLITNLIKSSSEPADELAKKKEDADYKWLYDYWTGKGFEIYRVPIPDSFQEKSFCDIASDVYKNKNLLLFALEIEVNGKASGEILLNPGNYKLPKPLSRNKFRYQYFGYIIADDKASAEAVFEDSERPETSVLDSRSICQEEKDKIAAEAHYDDDGDIGAEVDNLDGDWLNIQKVASKPVNREDIIFETMEASMLAEGHIIICGMVENIKHFVLPLRADHMKSPLPIVILHDELLSPKQWQQLQFFS
jgi:hypothetical protein